MDKNLPKSQAIEKLAELIEDIEIAMLTTSDGEGNVRSRPMATQELDEEGPWLWFFTKDDSPKCRELLNDSHVNVSYAKPADQRYVSVSGMAEVVHDRAKIEELWNPLYQAWFPEGIDDPHLALIRVSIDMAEYWDSPSGKMIMLFGMLKAVVTGEAVKKAGAHEKIDLRGGLSR